MKIHFKSLLSHLSNPNQTLPTTRILHGLIIKTRLSSDPFYATRILRFYAINNDLISARNLFDKTPQRTIFLWNSIIRAYAQAHKFLDAFSLFKRLLTSETRPDNFTFACVARACADKFDAGALRVIHGKVLAFGLGLDFICNSALVSCYSKLGLVDEAGFVFHGIDGPDLVLCNAMISGYGNCGDWAKGTELFNAMQEMGIRPDGYTVVGLINGLVDDRSINVGETVHGFCVKSGLSLNDHVGSVLVSMYSRCKRMEFACTVFDSLFEPDLVSWSSLISGFSQSKDHLKALGYFRKFLIVSGRRADPVLLVTVLAASAQSAILGPGLEIHGYAIRHKCDSEVSVSSALIEMYAKCGFLEMGVKVFDKMPERNLVSYNTVISSLGLYGRGPDAFRVFDEVLRVGLKPDEATFAGVLSACCHSGLVDEGRRYFKMMKMEFGIEAKTEHCVHMVKLLGMDGKLEEAYDLVRSLPGSVGPGVWGALLSCCDVRKDYELVEAVTRCLMENETKNGGYGVMISNLFARDGRWDDVEQWRVDDGGVKGKMAGVSWISGVNH
ncbi:putative pentatricopeptide repeat-containing protein at1g64310 [Phtheirospermum japonicum]|uniref:Putative pentatricopeptide repeat-containing protein at1g64310 n=1 Tax=Phtheirospermum japonicum TaxID=374723 RepID=A0A830BSB5_9LAMI|nr:putative pentatricopeptide repeat-containing protein at1g64310 [Phtheirospermum japonicum]